MKKTLFIAALAVAACKPMPKQDAMEATAPAEAENAEAEVVEQPVYRATETQLTDLVSTKLEVSFDWSKSQLKGKETLTAKPHFYDSDRLILDAKGMEIYTVTMNDKPLKFDYSEDVLTIQLDRKYKRSEQYTIVITYLSKPDEREAGGSQAITSDKGLYFINPTGSDATKMPQIWTQGETQSNSVWFPTIDSPNAKSTQEMFITVEDKYSTLSNGKLIGSKKNADGTRTDHWKQDLPHSPYLFMMGVGEFKVVKDTYKRPDGSAMEVNYYVEPKWEKHAKAIFGETPRMIGFFSQLTGVEYPWDKYSQIVVRDYVSGAMENTGAVVFGDFVYKTDRELLDENDNSTIAHELFHHWFGDLVTAESWSNLTLNESFANYSQYLWDEHRHGLDEADYNAITETDGYYASAAQSGYHDLVWFEYKSREDMFDGHSYNKGGRILHMLRNYMGDEAFFLALKNYLSENAYKPAEFHQLRLAFEKVTGEDLNWFFNQWYLASGHPTLEIRHSTANGMAVIDVKQTQNFDEFPLFRLPVNVTVYDDNGETTHRIWVNGQNNHFELPYTGTLKNVLFDTEQMLLAKKNETKDSKMYVHQYYHAKRYAARLDGLEKGLRERNAATEQLVLDAMKDPFWNIRLTAVEKFGRLKEANRTTGLTLVRDMVVGDSSSAVRAACLTALSGALPKEELQPFLEERIRTDRSYTVVGKALSELNKLSPTRAMEVARSLENEESSKMLVAIASIYAANGTEQQYDFFQRTLTNGTFQGFDAIGAMSAYTFYLSKQNPAIIRKGVSVFDYQAQNGGMYTQMFIGQFTDYMNDALNQRIAKYEEEATAAKKAGNTNAESIANANVAEMKAIQADFMRIKASREAEDVRHE
jgi:aminopeptidase N